MVGRWWVGASAVGMLLTTLTGCAGNGPATPTAEHPAVPALAPTAVPPRAAARADQQQRASRAVAARPPVPGWHPSATTATGIPRTVELAYRNAARLFHRYDPTCKLDKALLEAVGKVESDHAYNGYVNRKGEALLPIIGPALDGRAGVALIHASPLGTRLHGDRTFEHAVGPMQFLPGTFADWATAGHPRSRTADPENVFDAAATAAHYLCGSGGDLSDPAARRLAVLRYNSSGGYADTVESWFQAYSHGVGSLPDSKDAAAAARAARADNPPAPPAGASAPAGAPHGAPPAPNRPATPAGSRPAPAAPPAAPKATDPSPEQPPNPKDPSPVGDAISRLTGARPTPSPTSPRN